MRSKHTFKDHLDLRACLQWQWLMISEAQANVHGKFRAVLSNHPTYFYTIPTSR